jgi:hypothetical protein
MVPAPYSTDGTGVLRLGAATMEVESAATTTDYTRVMAKLKHIVLDVLKPHQPSVLELARAIAGLGPDYRVRIEVTAVDEKTESTLIEIEGDDLAFESVSEAITALGASVHSVDRVVVHGEEPSAGLPAN